MYGILQLVAQQLKDAGYRVHIGDVVEPHPVYPYVVLWGSGGHINRPTLGEHQQILDTTIGVTLVGLYVDDVTLLCERVRAILDHTRPIIPGWTDTRLDLVDSQSLTTDRQIKEPVSNRHPLFIVDIYRVIAAKD